MNKYLPLLTPAKIGSLELKNRLIFPPMTTQLNDSKGNYTDRAIAYYERRAKGGAAMIITDACFPDDGTLDNSTSFRITGDESIVRISLLSQAIHAHGAKFCVQLSGGQGRVGAMVNGQPPKAPSPVPWLYNPGVTCREYTIEEIKASIQAIIDVAKKCAAVGADAFDIHAHNGYLIDQFMSPQWNQRTDEYGGSLENRMRFPVELIQGLKAALGPGFPIIFRISVDQNIPGFRTVEDTIPMLKILENAGADALDVDIGVYECMDWMFPSYYLGDTPYRRVAKAVKEAGIKVPVLNSGSYTPEAALDAVVSGDVDFVMVGRGQIADPDWIKKLNHNAPEDIKPCIRCNDYCLKGVMGKTGMACAVNAQAGNEAGTKVEKTQTPLQVVIVGGGPGGMEAALVAKQKGHHVTLCEKSSRLGGMITAAATPAFKSQLKRLIDWYELQLKKQNITVKLNCEINADSSELSSADYIIIATGSTELIPPIEGIDGGNVVKVVDAHRNPELLKGENIVVAGGGLSGCDYALECAMEGKKVTVVEMRDSIAADMISINSSALKKSLAQYGVTVLVNHKITAFTGEGVLVEHEGEEKALAADTSILAFGCKPNDGIARAIRDKYPLNSRIIGDSYKVGKVGEAIREGFFAANDLE